jgi:hypothetical protein
VFRNFLSDKELHNLRFGEKHRKFPKKDFSGSLNGLFALTARWRPVSSLPSSFRCAPCLVTDHAILLQQNCDRRIARN